MPVHLLKSNTYTRDTLTFLIISLNIILVSPPHLYKFIFKTKKKYTANMESPFVAPDLCNWPQLLFLSMVYAYILCEGSNLISDGSELLLLVPSIAGIVGSVVLPVLGAVPDGMMVLFSGVDPATVNKQIGVGVGTMAGSTVMLLTMSWFLAIYGGRVNITKSGKCTYTAPEGAPEGWEKLYPANNTSLTRTGVRVKKSIKDNAAYML